MAEIEIGASTLDEFPQIAKMDLSFESEYVWKTQMLEGLGSIEASFQRIRLPKTIRVSFQAYSTANMEMLIRQHQILSVRYEDKVIGYLRLEQDETVNRLVMKTGGVTPEYRNKGVGLVMVRDVTSILKEEGYDISYIHYTGVAPWYRKLGYRTVLKWNKHGFLP